MVEGVAVKIVPEIEGKMEKETELLITECPVRCNTEGGEIL